MNETSIPQRKKRIIELDDALAKVKDGMTIGIGGFINSSHPMLVVRGLIKRGAKNITVVGPASSGLEIDLLIAAGVAKKVIAPYVGGEVLAPIGPAFRAAVERSKVEVFELDEPCITPPCVPPRKECPSIRGARVSEDVKKNTGFELVIPSSIPLTEVPSDKQLAVLRTRIDVQDALRK